MLCSGEARNHDFPQNFSVCWNETTRLVSMLGRVKVDGIYCGGIHLNRGSTGGNPVQVHSAPTSPTTERPLMFSRLELTGTHFLFLKQVHVDSCAR